MSKNEKADDSTMSVLFRRFLFASGWKSGPCPDHPDHLAWTWGDSHTVLGLKAGLPHPLRVAVVHRVTVEELHVRLGMCDAAERLLEHGRFLRDSNPKAEPTDSVMLICSALVDDAEQILKAAGVDPLRWEEARRA